MMTLLYIIKDVRKWYTEKCSPIADPWLRSIGASFLVDMDPYDWSKVKVNQMKDTNRTVAGGYCSHIVVPNRETLQMYLRILL